MRVYFVFKIKLNGSSIKFLKFRSLATKKEKTAITLLLRKTKQKAENAIEKINKWHSDNNAEAEKGLRATELTRNLLTFTDFENGFFPWMVEKCISPPTTCL